jgi:hypothetical protein
MQIGVNATMNNKLTVHWFDDNESKVNLGTESLSTGATEAGFEIEVHFHPLRPDLVGIKESFDSIRALKNDLLLVDHIINDSGTMNIKGSAVAHLLRLTFPNTPIVCVSAAWSGSQADTGFDQEDLSEYCFLIPESDIHDSAIFLRTIANDFPKISSFLDAPTSLALSILKAPNEDAKEVDRILPGEFQATDLKTTPHRLARWLLNSFLEQPGFLYDRLRVATMLGLTIEGFEKVHHLFVKAEYVGIFRNEASQRWWVSEVNNILHELLPEVFDRSQLAGRQLEGITENDHSKCWFDPKGATPPDAVAYIDLNNFEEVPVNSRYTRVHPKDNPSLPGFEARLVVVKAKG